MATIRIHYIDVILSVAEGTEGQSGAIRRGCDLENLVKTGITEYLLDACAVPIDSVDIPTVFVTREEDVPHLR